MTPADLRAWRKHLCLRKTEAARVLGIKPRTMDYYEAGVRNGEPVTIPRPVALACTAVACGLGPWPVGMASQGHSPPR